MLRWMLSYLLRGWRLFIEMWSVVWLPMHWSFRFLHGSLKRVLKLIEVIWIAGWLLGWSVGPSSDLNHFSASLTDRYCPFHWTTPLVFILLLRSLTRIRCYHEWIFSPRLLGEEEEKNLIMDKLVLCTEIHIKGPFQKLLPCWWGSCSAQNLLSLYFSRVFFFVAVCVCYLSGSGPSNKKIPDGL